MDFGKTLRTLRKKAGLTQIELAKKLSITQAAVTQYERGLSKPEVEKFPILAKLLNIPLEDLFNHKSVDINDASTVVHGNSRTAKIQEVFEQLPPAKQRQVLSHAQGLLKK